VHEVIVVGAGLAGLTAALHLAREGREVLVLERRARAGGLCGTYSRDGYEFVIGCNDFGTGMVRHMAELGVPVRFVQRRTRFVFANETYHVPPTPGTLLLALEHAPDIVRLVRAMSTKGGASRYAYLGEVVEHCIGSSAFADFIASLSYAVGLAPSAFPIEDLKAALSKELGYGYDKPSIPVGGPGALVEAMCTRLAELGGTLLLNTACERIEREGAVKQVVTHQGTFSARHVITSEGRWDEYPVEARPGLAVSVLHLAVKRSFTFPEGIHTLTCFPSNVAGWLGQLDRGELPRELGFHCFPTPDLGDSYYPINLYFYLPRGMEHPSPDVVARVTGYVLERAEHLLPGLSTALLYKSFVSAGEYVRLHGLASTPVPRAGRAGFQKPGAYEPERDVYHVGNSVYPPGDHAGAAVLSGIQAAQAVLRAT
jgi:phytoene dehydrogenase-like protein